MSVNLNTSVQGVKPEQYGQQGPVGNQPVQVQLGEDVHDVSSAEPNPQQSNQIVGNPPFPGQVDPNALNAAQQNLELPQEPPRQPQPMEDRNVAPGNPQPRDEQLHFDMGNGFHANGNAETGVGEFEVIERDVLKTIVDRNGIKSVQTDLGEFQEVASVDPAAEAGIFAKGDVKVADVDFKTVMALLASGKPGEGQFSVDPQTHAITTVNDNVLSFLNPKSNPALSGLVGTPAENKSIRMAVRDALLGEIAKLQDEIAAQKRAVAGDDPASARVRDALDALLAKLDATADDVQKNVFPPEKSKHTDALAKSVVKAFADELAEIGKALRTAPDVQTASDYKQALDDYKKTLDDYETVLNANKQALDKYESDFKAAAAKNKEAQAKYEKAHGEWKTKTDQAKSDYEKACKDAVEKAKADYEKKCAGERAKLREDAEKKHLAEHGKKVEAHNAFVAGRKSGMEAHLAELKTKFGTDKFDGLDHLKGKIFTTAPEKTYRSSYLQLDGSTKGRLNFYYYGWGDYSKVAENNKAARRQLQASLAHALWEAGLEGDEDGQALIAKLGGDSLEKALDYGENYATVKAVFDLIDAKGVKAPGEYQPLTEDELSALVQYDPPAFDESTVKPPPPQLDEEPSCEKFGLPSRPNLVELPPLGKLPPAPALGQKPAGNGVASLLDTLAMARREMDLAALQGRIPDLKTRQAALAREGLAMREELLKQKYGVDSFQPVFKLAQDKVRFRDYGARGWSGVTLDKDGTLSYSKVSSPDEKTNRAIRNQLMASLERETWRAGLADSKRMQAFLAHAAKTLQIGDPAGMGKWLDYVDAFELLHEFQVSVSAENPAFIASQTGIPPLDGKTETALLRKHGAGQFLPVFSLAEGDFAKPGNPGDYSVCHVDGNKLSYQSESGMNFRYVETSPEQNESIRRELMASFERTATAADLLEDDDVKAFLANAQNRLMPNGEPSGEKLDYAVAHELLTGFRNLVAEKRPNVLHLEDVPPAKAEPAVVPAEAPKAGEVANEAPAGVRPAGAPGAMGSLGLSYKQFGGQLLNPLVERLFEGMGVSLSGVSLSGDDKGLTLKIKTFDASGMGVGAADGLLAKYEDVTIPVAATWRDGRLSFTLGALGCADKAMAQRLNALVGIARESGVLGGLEMPKGMSVESGGALGVTCDFRQMDVAMLADAGLGSNMAETIGGVRFSEKGVMVDFGKVDDPTTLPELDEKSGAMEVHLNVGTILDRCQGFLTRMMHDALGVEVGSIGASTTADGIVKFSVKDAKVLNGGWLGTFGLSSISNLELAIRPTLNAETGLLEISLVDFDIKTGNKLANALSGLAKKCASYLLSWAVGYAPNMVCQKEPGSALAKVSLALPNLMPEQFSFLGSQKLEKLQVTEKGVSIGVGMDPKPIRFAKPKPPAPAQPPPAPEAPAQPRPVAPQPAAGKKNVGHVGTVGVSYKAFSDEILRPLMNQVATDLGVDVRGLSLSGSSGGMRLNMNRLDLQGMLAKLGDSSSPTVRGLLKAFKWQRFDNVSIPISAQWDAQTGKLVFELGEIEGASADGTTLSRLVQDVRATGLLRTLPASGAMAIVDEPNKPLKLSFDLSSASVKELKAMGFNERLADNVGDIRFRPDGVSLDVGAPRPKNGVIESPGLDDSALNAELDLGAIVANNQGLVKNALQSKGILTRNVSVRTNAKDGTVTVDLDQTNFDGLMDSWNAYGWYYKLAKPFLRTPGMSLKLRPSFDPATGKTTLAITDITVKGFFGPLTRFIGKMLIGPNWISSMAPNLLHDEKAGKGELVRVSFTTSNLLPSALAGFGSQKISGLKVTNRGIAVGVGTNWKADLLKSNQATQKSIQLQFARTRRRVEELLRNSVFCAQNVQAIPYLATLSGILDENVSTKALRERCEDVKNASIAQCEEFRQGWNLLRELVADEEFRQRFSLDDLAPASFPDVEDLADLLFATLQEE